MRNFFRFLWQHHFIGLFIILETLSFILVVSNNSFQKASFVSSSTRLTGYLYSKSSAVTQFFTLQQTNKRLAEENAFLKSRLPGAFQITPDYLRLVNDSLTEQRFVYRAARVINNSTNKQYNFITLDKGKVNGIAREMGVICADGIVGIVRETSPNYATVISALNTRLKISAKIKSSGYFGSIEWNGLSSKYVYLMEIPLHAKVKEGDFVVTSGFSAIFPEGIPIGVVEEIKHDEGESYYELKVKLSVDFNKLEYVEVIENKGGKEKVQLEKLLEKEND
jgi:rod shape-determining protein MreC